jgi:hypothetical protein
MGSGRSFRRSLLTHLVPVFHDLTYRIRPAFFLLFFKKQKLFGGSIIGFGGTYIEYMIDRGTQVTRDAWDDACGPAPRSIYHITSVHCHCVRMQVDVNEDLQARQSGSEISVGL